MTDDFFNYCLKCGFTEEEARKKVKEKEIMQKLYFSEGAKPEREITSSTYVRAQNRLTRDVNSFMGMKEEG